MVDIAIIDSGIGGLSLFSSFFKNLSAKKYLYLADIKNLPYGNKIKSQLLKITIKNIDYIIKRYNPKCIVFGCNTIGTTLLEVIIKIYPHIKIFAIKPNLEQIKNKKNKVLVLATNRTITSLKHKQDYILNNKNIILCKMPSLANKVEKYIQNTNKIVPYLKRRLRKFKQINSIVLGCTHYYFVKNQIKEILKPDKIVDGIDILTKQILGEKLFFSFEKANAEKIKINVKIKFTKKPKNKKEYKNIIKKMLEEKNKV